MKKSQLKLNSDEKEPIKIKIPTCEEKITKIKLQMNEHDLSFHVNNNS